METLSPQEITRLLADWHAGDAEALGRLAPLVYAELRSIARRQIGRGREGHTLTGLSVEEAAEALGISPTTVRRELRRAKARLYRAVAGGGGADEV